MESCSSHSPSAQPETYLVFSPYRYEGRVFQSGARHSLHFQASTYLELAGLHPLAGQYSTIKKLQAKIRQFPDGHNWRIAGLTPTADPNQFIVIFESDSIGLIEYQQSAHAWQRQNADSIRLGDQPEIVLECLRDPRPVHQPELSDRSLSEFARAGYYAFNGIRPHQPFPHHINPFQFGWVKVEHNEQIAYVKYESALAVRANGTLFNF